MTEFSRIHALMCQRQLDLLMTDAADVRGALIATTDGFELARAPAHATFAASKLAAMASSIFALGEATAREVQLSQCRNVLVDAVDGRLLLLSVPTRDFGLVLCVFGSEHASLGYLLAIARKHVEALVRQFD
jgi:predicted regulator of Ras-like GTPase activity (Roadblock/LC7/MglB family)